MPMQRPSFTIGIEEEYQIIDPETRELKSFITQFLEGDKSIFRQLELKPELHQSIVEVGTTVCHNVQDARTELANLRRMVAEFAKNNNSCIAAAATHPFSSWQQQDITPYERYAGIVEDMQDLAREQLIFGMHVHVGIEDQDLLIDTMNIMRYMTPHILALSTSSPFWQGRNTGLKSYRSALFKRFPRTGLPSQFMSFSEYQSFIDTLVETGCIPDASKIYWDVRPHHSYPTLEFRICDLCTNIDDAICCAALFQALAVKHYKMRRDNLSFKFYRNGMVEENKWRAMRYGIHGKMIDFGTRNELATHDLIHELVEFVDDVLDELGSRKEAEHAFTILERGTSADRQVAIYDETGDVKAVVDWLIEETVRDCQMI
ncbi:MAG: carboxylate-amine ligase [Deinococcota bacterium]